MNNRCIQLLLLFILFFSLHSKASSYETLKDSSRTKSKFDLNDPRNPSCPCHKQQHLADEEYKKLLVQHKIKAVESKIETQNKIKNSAFTKTHRSRLNFFSKHHQKNKPKKNHKLLRDITACFHWG